MIIKRSFSIFFDPRMILIIPIVFFNGYKQAILYGKIPRLISESLPSEFVGYSLSIFGTSEICAGITIGKLSDKIGNIYTFFITVCILFLSILMTYFIQFLKPYFLFATMFVLGWADASLNTVSYSIVSTVFVDETSSAFASYKLIQSVGTICSLIICLYLQLKYVQLISTILLMIGLISILILHLFVSNVNKN